MAYRHQPARGYRAGERSQKAGSSPRKRARRVRRLQLEQLETRRLLSGNPPPVETNFLPFPAADVLKALETIQPPSTTKTPVSPVSTYTAITVAGDGARIYYDQWENGYVADIANPTPAETYSATNLAGVQIWGDGDASNGIPPYFANDELHAGDVVTLKCPLIPIPRLPSEIFFDGGDKIAASKSIAIAFTSWAASTTTMLTSALTVNDTNAWGSDYDVPIGRDTNPSLLIPQNFFDYTGLTIMAAKDGTTVKIDPNGDGVFEVTVSLNQGQAYLFNSEIPNPDPLLPPIQLRQGARVVSVLSGDLDTPDLTKPVQVDLITGRTLGNYASRWIPLSPRSHLASSYATPVSTGAGQDFYDHPTAVYLFNPNSAPIQVTYVSRNAGGTGSLVSASITVPARGSARQLIPEGSGARFFTAGNEKFYATSITDVADDVMAEDGSIIKLSSSYEWSFAVASVNDLARQAQVSLGLGRDPTSDTKPNENGSPVWVTPVGNGDTPVIVCVDYASNGNDVGPLTDPNGFHYDAQFSLRELQRQKIFDPSGNQSGMLVYTLSADPNVRLAVAWGEDPISASWSQPGIDAGTIVAPLQDFAAGKIGTLAVDVNADGTVSPGDTLQYTINVVSASRQELANVNLVDHVPTNSTYVADSTRYFITLPDGTVYPVPPAVIPDGPGSSFPLDGAGFTLPILPPLATWTVTFRAKIKDTPTPGVCSAFVPGTIACVVNTGAATVSSLGETIPLFWETPVFQSYADLAITKTDGTSTYVPGSSTTYTMVVSNLGPSNVVAAPVQDLFPSLITSAVWTASASPGASVADPSGTGNINTTVNLVPGSTVTFTVTATTDPAATIDLVNTATVQPPANVIDPNLSNNTASDTDTPRLVSDLAISKTDGSATYTPGLGLTYTIVVSNLGPSNAVGATLADTFDVALGTPSWTATGTAGTVFVAAGSGNLSQTVGIPFNGSITYTVTVAQVNPAKTGDLLNTATVQPPTGVTDPNLGNNTATDSDTPRLVSDLAITKTDGSATYTPGLGLIYTIVVSNLGPSNAVGATVADTFDAALGTPSWTATGTAGTVFAAAGSGNLAQTVSIPASGSITYTVTVAQVNPAKTGDLLNTATVQPPAGVTDPNLGNNTATDSDTPRLVSDLAISKTDGSATYTPGQGLTYTIVVSNLGPSNAAGATLADTFDTALGTPPWTATGTAGTVFVAAGFGNLSQTVSIPASGSITYTVTVAQVNPAKTGDLLNTATVQPPAGVTDPNLGNNTATDSDTPRLVSDLAISKTDGSATYTPGQGLTYTIVVSNLGPSNAVGATAADTFDAALGTPPWTATGTAGTVFVAAGSGNLAQTVSIPASGSITYTVTVAQVNPAKTGDLLNTATVQPPTGVTDPNLGNNTATDSDTPRLVSDLAISKTDGSATYTPGTGLIYTIVVSNLGPSNAVGATLADTFEAALGTPPWTATGTAGTVFVAAGSGNLAQTVSIPASGSITYTVTVAQVNPAKTGDLINTATVQPPAGVTDPNLGNNTATDSDTPRLVSDLAISKTDGSATYTPGLGLTYTIVVSNLGPSNAVGATVADTFDAALGTPPWTASGTVGTVFVSAGTGNLTQTVSIPASGSITYTVTVAQVNPGKTGDLINTATVQPPAGVTDPNLGNNTATDSDTPRLVSDLAISKTDGSATYTPGLGLIYTIVVSNLGPSNAVGATVADAFDVALGTPPWTATGTAGTVFVSAGSGNLSQTVSIPVSGSITYTVTVAQVNPGKTGDLINTAAVQPPTGVTDPNLANNTATDSDTPRLVSDLAISKTDGSATYTPGLGLTYTIVVSNLGPSNAVGATVADTFDAALGTPPWTASGTVGTVFVSAGSGNLAQTVSIPASGSITYTVTVAQVNPAKTGDLINTATVQPPAGVTDPNLGNNTATDSDTPRLVSDLAISKTDGSTTYTPGAGLIYTIVVSNLGPSNAVGATVADTFDAALGTPPWTASGTVGTVFVSAGSGNLVQTVSIPASGSITYTVTVAQVNPAKTGDLINTATVQPPAGVTDPNLGNNTATDSDTPRLVSDLAISKTDGSTTYTPGLGLTYTIVVSNLGPSNAVGATVADTFDAALGTPPWTATGTAGTVFVGVGSGNLSQTVSIPASGSITYTVTVAQVNPAKTGDLLNTATVQPPTGVTDPNLGNNTATDSDTPRLVSDLAISKTDGSTTYTPGLGLTYTIVVSNLGPSNAVGAAVADTFDAALGTPPWTATGTVGTVFVAAGTGNLAQTVSIPASGSITYTVTVAQVNPAKTGDLLNTATVQPPAGVTDPNLGNNTATDSDSPRLVSDLAISKTDGSTTYTPGLGLTYTIVVSNLGPSNAVGTTVADTFDAALGTPPWTASGTVGTVFVSAGSGNLAQTVSIPASGSITYTVTVAQVNPAKTGDLLNTATVQPPAGVTDPNLANNTATDSDTPRLVSDLAITKTDGSATYTPGLGLIYTIVVSNLGPSNVVGATVGDTFDAALGTPPWTATGTAGTVFVAAGSGNLAQTVGIPVSGSITYTVTVAQVNPAKTGDLINTATVQPPTGVTDPNLANNTATDSDTPRLVSDLAITKTDGSATYTPGLGLIYTIVVSNLGPSNAVGATVADTFDTALGTPAWTANGTVGTVFVATGSGHLAQTVGIPASGSITYTVTVAQVNPAKTGDLLNTATVQPPTGVTDPDLSNNTATDSDTPRLVSDLAINKTDGSGTYRPGLGLTYTIVVSNLGPSNAVGATVADTFDWSLGTPPWTATGTAGTVFVAAGSGNLAQTVGIPAHGSITYTVTVAQVDPAKTGDLVNTATVQPPAGVTDPNLENNTSTDIDTPAIIADLAITKTDGSATYTPGLGLTYTIVVSNLGPSNAVGATVADAFDAALGTPPWTATGTAGTVFVGAGSGNLAQTVSIPASGSITYTVTVAQVNPAKTGDLLNTATVQPPTGVIDPNLANNTATDSDTPRLVSDLAISKTDGSATYTPGLGLTYTIVVSNLGPSNVVGATVADTFDAALGTPPWTATGTAGTAFVASGSGNLLQTVGIPVSGSITYTVTVAQVNPAKTGDLLNTATVQPPTGVTDPNLANNTATDSDTPRLVSDLAITKTDGSATYTPGLGLIYTIVVSNLGPSNAVGATVADTFDTALGTPAWTVTGTVGTVFVATGSGHLAQTVGIPASGSITYTVTVAQVNPAKTGDLLNTATVQPPTGVTDPDLSNNTATDSDTPRLVSDLAISKTDGSGTYRPGLGLTYTIVVSNLGPSNAVGATVADTFDWSLGTPPWTATGTVGTVFVAAGSGNLAQTVGIPAHGSITYTVTVAQVNPAKTGDLINTATVQPPAGVTDPNLENNTSTDIDTPVIIADLAITKTDGSATYTPGLGLTYTIVASNLGPSNVVGATVADTFDAALGTPPWTATGTAGTVFVGAGSGNLAQTVSIPASGSITYTVTVAQVNPAKTGDLLNTATVQPPTGVIDPNLANNTATDTDTPRLVSDLAITKTDGSATYTPGLGLTYTIVVSNLGPSNVLGATVLDTFDVALGTPPWTATGTAGTVFVAAGSGNLSQTVSLPTKGSITYTVTVAQVNPAKTGDLVNTATVRVPPGVTDPVPENNTATDTDTPRLVSDLAISKTDGSATYTPGTGLTYTIVVRNLGPSNVVGATVADTFDAALGTPPWTATGTAGTVFVATGSGHLSQTVGLPANGSITYTVTVAQVDPARTGDLVNTATVHVPPGVTDPVPENNTATDSDTPRLVSDLAITKTDGSGTYTPGLGLTYTIVVRNLGPSTVVGATVADTFDWSLGTPPWTASGTVGTVFVGAGLGNLSQTVGIPARGSITYTVTVAQVDPAKTGDLVNTATVQPPAGVFDPDLRNNTDTDTDTMALDIYIGGYKWNDANANGLWDMDEVGLADWTIYLDRDADPNNGVLESTITGPDGDYEFEDLVPGTYYVYEALRTGWINTYNGATEIVAESGHSYAGTWGLAEPLNFGNYVPPTCIVLGPDKSPSTPERVLVVDQLTGQTLASFVPYENNFQGGVRVATGDLNGDGIDEIVTAPGRGRAPELRVFTQQGVELPEFRTLAYAAAFMGGVQVAVADVNGDGMNDLITVPSDGPVEVKVFLNQAPSPDPIRDTPYRDFLAFPSSIITGGVVGAADMGHGLPGAFTNVLDGKAEIVVGTGPGTAATVNVFDVSGSGPYAPVRTLAPFADILFLGAPFAGGVSLSVAQIDSDLIPDIVVGAGPAGQSRVGVWTWAASPGIISLLGQFPAFPGPSSPAPVRVAAADTNADGIADTIVAVQGPSGFAGEVHTFRITNLSPFTVVQNPPLAGFPDGYFVATVAPPSIERFSVLSSTGEVPDYQNPTLPEDVNNDGKVSALDALLLINFLNLGQSLPPAPVPPAQPQYYWDVDGNNVVTPSDVLQVVNRLELHTLSAGEGEDTAAATPAASPATVAARTTAESLDGQPGLPHAAACAPSPANPPASAGPGPASAASSAGRVTNPPASRSRTLPPLSAAARPAALFALLGASAGRWDAAGLDDVLSDIAGDVQAAQAGQAADPWSLSGRARSGGPA